MAEIALSWRTFSGSAVYQSLNASELLMRTHRLSPFIFTSMALLAACASAQDTREFDTEQGRVKVVTVAAGLEHPWGLAFLPDGRMLVTERPGRMRIVTARGELSAPLTSVPAVVAEGQGGLLDVILAPDFVESKTIYFSYSESRDGGNGTSVARARLADNALRDVKVIFRQMPAVQSAGHFGSRLVFARDGMLFVTLGDRQQKHFAVRAQDLETHFGKVVRIKPDGAVPKDNPFVDVPGAQPEIWSYGHRNVQGAALHPTTGELWTVEHGARGGDELNIARASANYGWPLVTYGVAYSGDKIGVGKQRAGIEDPVHYWVPSIATSGLAFYTGDKLPAWRGNVIVGALGGSGLARIELNGNAVKHHERLLVELRERIRDVRSGPDGYLYLLTDSPKGRVLRVEPAK
jgi:glucose/arabinose dehydrogenase